MKRKCVICGARVRNQNPKCNTCDPICTRAKKNGLSRPEQALKELWEEEQEEQEEQKRRICPFELYPVIVALMLLLLSACGLQYPGPPFKGGSGKLYAQSAIQKEEL